MKQIEVILNYCPNCRQPMKALGQNNYECLTPNCRVIEIHKEFRKPLRIKVEAHWNGFNGKFVEGKCQECGKILHRRRPADTAVCNNNGHKALLVALT